MKRLTCLLLACLTALALTACGAEKPQEISLFAMDTYMTLAAYGDNADEALTATSREINRLEATLSRTIDTSDVSRLNAGEAVEVQPETRALLERALTLSDETGGTFDMTVAPLVALWGITSDAPRVPSQEEIDALLPLVGGAHVHMDEAVTLDAGCAVDLGGIAKGYVGDEMRKVLKKEGVTSAVINLGGNIVTVGTKPDGSEYTIGIEKPFSDRQEIIGRTHIGEGTVVTSGIYERQFEYKGKRYHHILSPKTGYPVDTDLEAVSLVTTKNSSMDTDAMSTICLMKGTKAAKKFIDSQKGIEAAFYGKDDKTSTTEGMDFEAE